MNRIAHAQRYRGWLTVEGDVATLKRPSQTPLNLDDFEGIAAIHVEAPSGRRSRQTITGGADSPRVVVRSPMHIAVEGELRAALEIDISQTLATSQGDSGDSVALDAGVYHHVIVKSGEVRIKRDLKVHRLSTYTDMSLVPKVQELGLRVNNLTVTDPGRPIGTLTDERNKPDDMLTVTFRSERSSSSGLPKMTIQRLTGPTLIHLVGVEIAVEDNDGAAMTLKGKGGLCVPRGRTLSEVTVPEDTVALHLNEDASIRGFSGVCRISRARNATIEATHDSSFEYVGLTPGESSDDRLDGLTMRGVIVKPGHEGRNRLSELTSIRAFEPHIDSTSYSPKWRRLFQSVARMKRAAATDTTKRDEVSRMIDRTHFYKEFDALVWEKCGSGAIRSRAAWDRARAQHLDSGRVERWMYGLFRLVGYGQRPLPAIGTWIVMSLIAAMTAVLLGAEATLWSTQFVTLWLYLLFTPFVLFKFAAETQASTTDLLAGLDPLDRQVVLFMQVLVVASFVFFVAAIRNYMRSSLPR